MMLDVEVLLKWEEDEPNLVAAAALEALARQLREEAPHDFVTGGQDDMNYRAKYRWKGAY